MSRETLFHASSLALDRVMLYGGPVLTMSIDDAIHSKSGLALGMEVATQMAGAARQYKPVKVLMDGGLMFNLKMECVLRQKRQQLKGSQ